MKRGKKAGCILFALAFFFFGCAKPTVPEVSNAVTVVIVEGTSYSCMQDVMETECGKDVVFSIELADGYAFSSCNYAGEYEVLTEGQMVTLRLFNVQYDKRLVIETQRVTRKIVYCLNGGSFIDESKNGTYFTEFADTTHHLRVNTNIGMEIYRDGYTQVGWNTQEDGSGRHVGLGSRVTVEENASLTLYAEWIEWADSSLFAYEWNEGTEEEGDVTLVEYLGSTAVEVFSIPQKIDGKKVTGIKGDFSKGLCIETLVLPNSIISVEENAFRESLIEEIYFFDNIISVNDNSFGANIPTAHINAALAPRYSMENYNAQFAEDMDRLILNMDKKKMVFFAGCSMSYGLNSKKVEETFESEYVICNMGVIGGTNATFQIDCITAYLGEGDVFIHAPEEMSPYQLFHNVHAESRMFVCTENNYDLLALANFSNCDGFFKEFENYNKARLTLPERAYSDFNPDYNEYGDLLIERPNSAPDTNFNLAEKLDFESINETSFARANEYYGRIIAQGAQVYYSFAPLNKNSFLAIEKQYRIWETYFQKIEEGLNDDVKIISAIEDYMMEGQYFYDTDYHLTTSGAEVRTEFLIEDIQKAMGVCMR